MEALGSPLMSAQVLSSRPCHAALQDQVRRRLHAVWPAELCLTVAMSGRDQACVHPSMHASQSLKDIAVVSRTSMYYHSATALSCLPYSAHIVHAHTECATYPGFCSCICKARAFHLTPGAVGLVHRLFVAAQSSSSARGLCYAPGAEMNGTRPSETDTD